MHIIYFPLSFGYKTLLIDYLSKSLHTYTQLPSCTKDLKKHTSLTPTSLIMLGVVHSQIMILNMKTVVWRNFSCDKFYVEEKWRIFGLVTKILPDKFLPMRYHSGLANFNKRHSCWVFSLIRNCWSLHFNKLLIKWNQKNLSMQTNERQAQSKVIGHCFLMTACISHSLSKWLCFTENTLKGKVFPWFESQNFSKFRQYLEIIQ